MSRHTAKYAVLTALVTLCCSVSPAQTATGTFSVDYFPNLNQFDGLKRVVNTGFWSDSTAGNLCDMIYVFTREQLAECCGCYVTPNGSRDFDVKMQLASNTLTGVHPNEVLVKQVSSGPLGAGTDVDAITCTISPDGSISCPSPSIACDPRGAAPMKGLRSWATKTQVIGSLVNITETNSQDASLGAAEQADLVEDCGVLIELGSGQGLCTCGGFD
jgi:hypothetical protein